MEISSIYSEPIRRISQRSVRLALLALTVFTLLLSLWRINAVGYTYFDEPDYIIDAKALVHLTLPPTVNEVPNPPLGKIIMGIGILVAGDNPLGWHLMTIIFGVAMIPLTYFFARRLFGTTSVALLAPLLLTLDFMHFTLSRLAIVETFLVFFGLLMQVSFYAYFTYARDHNYSLSNKRLAAFAVLFALALSSKWPAVFSFLGLVAVFIYLTWRRFQLSYKVVNWWRFTLGPLLPAALSLILVGAIYFLSYLPYLLAGENFGYTLYRQLAMFQGHLGPANFYPYASPWWSAPLILIPVPFIFQETATQVQAIILMGNPAIWWTILPISAISIYRAVRQRDATLSYLLVAFFSSWLPYAFATRFILYYFYFSSTIGILLVTYWLQLLWRKKFGRILVGIYLTATAGLFLLFYPILSAQIIPIDQARNLQWLPNWQFLLSLL